MWQCLSYDFTGTAPDESSDEHVTVQVPASWLATKDETTIGIFFEIYAARPERKGATSALECACHLASVRRSIFSESERRELLCRLLRETMRIMETMQGLKDEDNHHAFCRLLGRLKTNYQLSELVASEPYPAWIKAVTDFSIKSLHSWRAVSDNSVGYLLVLWASLVQPLPYLREGLKSELEDHVPLVFTAFIESRLALSAAATGCELGVDDDDEDGGAVEDPLDQGGDGEAPPMLEALPLLARLCYSDSAQYIAGLIDDIGEQLEASREQQLAMMNSGAGDQAERQAYESAVLEGKLAWLVYIISVVIGGFLQGRGTTEEVNVLNAELCARVFRVLVVCAKTKAVPPAGDGEARERLELAFLHFFQNFSRMDMGEGRSGSRDPSRPAVPPRWDRAGGGGGSRRGDSSQVQQMVVNLGLNQYGRGGAPAAPSSTAASRGGGGMSVASDVEEMGISEQSGGAMGDGKDEDETPTLMSLLEVDDRKDVLEIVVQKLIGNLQYDPNREGGAVATGCTERVMKRTLFVFQEMAGGVSVIHARIGLGAGLRTTPRLVSSAALVLESDSLTELLTNYQPEVRGVGGEGGGALFF
jgi:hypothetical protein